MTKAENYNYSNDLINGYHERKTAERTFGWEKQLSEKRI